ncbi:MAG: hypothetical protein ABSG08_22850, partial [Terriglobales bacterium]
SNCCSSFPRMPSSYQVVLWKQESFVVLRPLHIEFFRNLLDIRLGWKNSPDAPVKSIGCYRLNLPALLSGGYVRQEGPATIRLQFVHQGDGIYIRVREESPRLCVGDFGDGSPV